MNDIFSFKRFALLMKAHWKENRKRELWLLALLLLALLLRYLSMLILAVKGHAKITPGNIQSISYAYFQIFSIGMIYLAICAGGFFRNLSNKESAMFALSTPASKLERTSMAFLFTMIIYPIIFFVLGYVFDFFFLDIYTRANDIQRNIFTISEFSFDQYLGFFTMLSVIVCGSVFFKKRGVLISILILMTFFMLQLIVATQMIPENAVYTGEIYNFAIMEKGTYNTITINGFIYYFKYLLFPLLWILTLLSLKEREV